MSSSPMYIGALAKATGLSPKAIRYYEELGLLSDAMRTESGYRVYTGHDVERLRFILGAKALGFSLNEIKDIVALHDGGESPCGAVRRMLDEKLAALDRRIGELSRFRDELKAYKERTDAVAPSAEVPCAHIAGAVAGSWQPSAPDPGTELKPKAFSALELTQACKEPGPACDGRAADGD